MLSEPEKHAIQDSEWATDYSSCRDSNDAALVFLFGNCAAYFQSNSEPENIAAPPGLGLNGDIPSHGVDKLGHRKLCAKPVILRRVPAMAEVVLIEIDHDFFCAKMLRCSVKFTAG